MSVWISILFALFFVSIVVGSLIQRRWVKRYGWRYFHKIRSPKIFRNELVRMYWGELSVFEKVLFWPGIIMFLLTWLIGMVGVVVERI